MEWTRDGDYVLFDSSSPFGRYLWRVRADGTKQPERLEAAGLGASDPTAARSRDRLAFSQWRMDSDIYQFEAGHQPRVLIASSSSDDDPDVSPNGRQVAFSSIRGSETTEIWVSDKDGSGSHQLTHGPGLVQGSPRWSPDGRRIAFESLEQDGRRHVWTIDSEGGVPRRASTEVAGQSLPFWSRDGKWLYYSTDDGSGRDIWRVGGGGGRPERVTKGTKALDAGESIDGKSLLYQADPASSNKTPLMSVSIAGGAPTMLVPCVQPFRFVVATQGVYYLECSTVMRQTLHLLKPSPGKDQVLGSLDGVVSSLSITPDGRSVVYSKLIDEGANLMLIENFK